MQAKYFQTQKFPKILTNFLLVIALLGGIGFTSAIFTNSQAQTAHAEVKTFDWLKTEEALNSELEGKTDDEILNSDDLKLALLQRVFVQRVKHDNLAKFASDSADNETVLQWLFTDLNRLEAYLLGGTPEGGEGKYVESLKALSAVYAMHSDDLNDVANQAVYQKMMMAISLAYGSPVNGWQTANDNGKSPWITDRRTPSEPVARYEAIKSLLLDTIEDYEDIPTHFESATFRDLEIEEMRWVVNNRISDKEIPWLNWYTQKVSQGKTGYGQAGYMNPYNYISYDGTFKWYYEDPAYYQAESTNCAKSELGNMHKSNASYERGENCNQKYGLKYFNLETVDESPLRLWTIWEEDGVCGSIAGVGTNIQMAYGIPSSLVSQPGHAAYFQSRTEEYNNETRRLWEINNNCGNWSNSYKGERMPLNWGTRGNNTWTDSNNASYLIAAQSALDHFDAFKKSFYYNLLADLHTDSQAKIDSYSDAIRALPYNVDSWYGLIQLLLKDDEGKFDQEDTMLKYQTLAENIMSHMKEFPLPMYDLLKLIVDKVGTYQVAYIHHFNKTLNELSELKPSQKPYFQTQAILDIVRYIQGKAGDTDIAEFSFDGPDGMKLKLKNGARDAKSPFEYSVTTNLDNYEEKENIPDTDDPDNGDWIEATDGELDVDLTDQLARINDTNDILVHLLGTPRQEQNIFRIDLTQGDTDEIEVNELERKIAGADPEKAEWILVDPEKDLDAYIKILQSDLDPYAANDLEWKQLSDEQPVIEDESNKGKFDLWFRYGYTGTNTPSSARNIIYGNKPNDNPVESYVSNQHLSVASTLEDQTQDTSLSNLLDNDRLSFWQNHPDDKQHFLTYTLDQPIQLTRLDYIIQQQKNAAWGNITKAQIQTSLDGENYKVAVDEIDWPWKQDQSNHTYKLPEPVYAKYIRIVPLEVYNNNSNVRVTMFNFYQNKETKTKLADLEPLATLDQEEFTYTGQPFQPIATIGDYNETTLDPAKDFTVEYSDNINAGQATVTLTGAGDHYTGTLTKNFTIKKAPQPFTQPEDSYELSADADPSTASLPAGWQWEDANLAVEPGQTVTTNAVYRGSDAANFENLTKSVRLARAVSASTNPSTPGSTDIPSSDPGTTPGTSTEPSNPGGTQPSSPSSQPSTPGSQSSGSSPSNSSNSNNQSSSAAPSSPASPSYSAPSRSLGSSVQIAQVDSSNDSADPATDSSSSDTADATDDEALTDGPLKEGARGDSATSSEATKAENEAIDQELDSEDDGMALYIVIGVILVLALLAGAYFYFRHRRNQQ